METFIRINCFHKLKYLVKLHTAFSKFSSTGFRAGLDLNLQRHGIPLLTSVMELCKLGRIKLITNSAAPYGRYASILICTKLYKTLTQLATLELVF